MAKRQLTEEQRKAMGERLAKARAAKKAKEIQLEEQITNEFQQVDEEVATELGEPQLMDMIKELQAGLEEQRKINNAILAGQASVQQTQPSSTKRVNILYDDIKSYQSPVDKLYAEPRLQRIGFNHQYEVDFSVSNTISYEKKDGTMERQPMFKADIIGIIMDDQGEPTSKRYIAKRITYFEDPETAVTIADRNNVDINEFGGERAFLDAIRYMRLRDWVFEFFWPAKPTADKSDFKDEVIGNQIVRTFQKSVVEGDNTKIDYTGLGESRLK